MHDEFILLIQPWYAPFVPELPGGGLDAGEDALSAINREFREETGFAASFTPDQVEKTYTQDVRFYADDENEYWHYLQHFFLVRQGLSPFVFEDEMPTPENGVMRWWPVGALPDLTLHFMHRKALAVLDWFENFCSFFVL